MTVGTHEAVLTDVPDQVSTEQEALDFDRLVVTEQPRIRALAWRFGTPASELDDVVQEVFIKAWSARDRFRGDANPTTWLTRIAINCLVSRRRSFRTRLRAVSELGAAWMKRPRRPDDRLASSEAEAKAAECVRRLPAKLRVVFVLRYLEEKSALEVAEILSIPEATVRTRGYRARKQLRAMLKDHTP